MNNIDKKLLKEISFLTEQSQGAYNIRKNGAYIEEHITDNINIVAKTDKPGIDIYVKENTRFESVHIPVIITQSGFNDVVYNDFHIGKNANVLIIAGCGIYNCDVQNSQHDGIHRFFLEKGAKVKYVEKHYGEGKGTGKKIINPITEVHLEKGSSMEIETVQIKGVDSTLRDTKGVLDADTNLSISEKIMTHGKQIANTNFTIELNGKNSSTNVVSRAVAVDKSVQEFKSNVIGNAECFGHVECDAIIKDKAKVVSMPEITANNIEARLIHEATIGKIAGEQLEKLMTLGLTKKEAEEEIIKGFLE